MIQCLIHFVFVQDVVPYIADHWEELMPNRQQSINWITHIYRALATDSVFSTETEGEDTFYSLVEEVREGGGGRGGGRGGRDSVFST